jgi:hypothetical protein
MSQRPPRPPRPERVIALFVAVTWAAVVFAVDGLISVLLNRDPIGGNVSPYYGILALAVTGVLLWVVLASTARSRTPWFGTVGVMAAAYLLLVGSAATVDLPLLAQQAMSPFVVAASLLAGVTVVAFWVGIRRWGPLR